MSHNKQLPTLQSPPLANYSSAIARAVEWLGDRYLLARPINTPTRSAASTMKRVGPVATTGNQQGVR
jgi:hypothetical protein